MMCRTCSCGAPYPAKDGDFCGKCAAKIAEGDLYAFTVDEFGVMINIPSEDRERWFDPKVSDRIRRTLRMAAVKQYGSIKNYETSG